MRACTGPLLDGFHAGGAPELAHWFDGRRERIAHAFAKALEQLAATAADAKQVRTAADWWRRLAAAEPFNSRIALRLMEALEAAGDRTGALRHARVHAALLEQEFGAGPDPEVHALAERLRTSAVAPPTEDSQWNGRATAAEPPSPSLASGEQALPVKAGEVAPVSAHNPDSARSTPPPYRRRRIGRRPIIFASLLVLAALAVLSTFWPTSETSARAPAVPDVDSARSMAIAVLPCTNLSDDAEQEHFSDGLTEELTGLLAQVRSLRVAARTSAFAFKGANRDVREIGRVLGVGTLLECSVRRAGERVRVTAQLIDAGDGFHLWAETYDREGTDVFAIQSDLALRIVGALEAELTPAERTRIGRRPTDSPEAHTLYLKGRYFWNQRTEDGFARAIEAFQQAIAIDPRYAQAHAGLAYVYSMQGLSGELTPEQSGVRTRDAALRALELDPGLSEAYTVLGGYYHAHAWDSEASERAHRRALELDPSYSTGHHWYGNLLASMGRLDEAIAEKQTAVQLDPLTPQLSNSLGYTLLEAGRAQEALQAFRDALEVGPTYWAAHMGMAEFYGATGQLEEALHSYQRAAELADNATARAALARTLALMGRTNEARSILADLEAEAARTGIHAPSVAFLFVALDDVEGALAWLERSHEQKHPELRFMGRPRDPRLADHPRFRELRRRLGLPL